SACRGGGPGGPRARGSPDPPSGCAAAPSPRGGRARGRACRTRSADAWGCPSVGLYPPDHPSESLLPARSRGIRARRGAGAFRPHGKWRARWAGGRPVFCARAKYRQISAYSQDADALRRCALYFGPGFGTVPRMIQPAPRVDRHEPVFAAAVTLLVLLLAMAAALLTR